jgi:asparagine synthase (glutamine-hydrolysing)
MIYGAVFSDQKKIREPFPFLRKPNQLSNLSIYPFDFGSFKGGCFLNRKLPKEHSDLIYFSQDFKLTILLSGNVFNKEALLKELSVEIIAPDSELIYLAYKKWGFDFVKKINGDFVIILFFQESKELYIFRDHLGIQPIAFSAENSDFFFSSDYFSLCRVLYGKDKIQSEYLLEGFKFVSPKVTPNEKVQKLPPGHFLKFANGSITITKYWFPEKVKKSVDLSYDQVIRDLKSLLHDSVKIRCDKKYVAGSHLSGGLDSGLVAALVRKNYLNQSSFFGFSYSPHKSEKTERSVDERLVIKEIAKQNDIIPVFSDLEVIDIKKLLYDSFFNLGSFWEENIRKNSEEKGINLLFSGWGGDEFLSKPIKGVDLDLFLELKWRSFLDIYPIGKPKELIYALIFNVLFTYFGILNNNVRSELNKRAKYLKTPFNKNDEKVLKQIFQYTSRRDQQLKIINHDSIAERCERWYLQGFQYGLEYRYPLLDFRIIEYVLKLPSEFFVKGKHSRIIMRDLSEGLLPENARWLNSKLDYSHFLFFKKMVKELAFVFITEVEEWEKNQDLEFIDFERLKSDIQKHKKSHTLEEDYYLQLSLFYFKKLHEFTKTYRSLPEQTLGEDNSANF